MIQEAMEYIKLLVLQAQKPEIKVIKERTYYTENGGLNELRDHINDTIEVSTLTGLAKIVNSPLTKKDRILHVVSPFVVTLCAEECDAWGRRQYDVACKLPSFGKFAFGEWMDQERFIIGLQSFFGQDMPDMAGLYQLAGNLTAEQVQNATDDGITQRATARTGMVLASNVTVKPRVDLKPWRTFREIEQPKSTFLLRLRNNDKMAPPQLSLHIADGEMWQNDAIARIEEWLKAHTEGVRIVA